MEKMYNIHEAKTYFSELVHETESGKEILIARAGKVVAKLIPFREKPRKRKLGAFQGEIWMSEDFNAPLPPDIQKFFEG